MDYFSSFIAQKKCSAEAENANVAINWLLLLHKYNSLNTPMSQNSRLCIVKMTTSDSQLVKISRETPYYYSVCKVCAEENT